MRHLSDIKNKMHQLQNQMNNDKQTILENNQQNVELKSNYHSLYRKVISLDRMKNKLKKFEHYQNLKNKGLKDIKIAKKHLHRKWL